MVARSALLPAARLFLRNQAVIFMLHRFEDPELGSMGHSAAHLDRHLGQLRRYGFRFLGLEELLRRLESGGDLSGAVAFTVDDGYTDFVRQAAPVFARHDCPVTVFLPSRFTDGDFWLWWDVVLFAMEETARHRIEFAVDEIRFSAEWNSAAERRSVASRIILWLKRIPSLLRGRALANLLEVLEVDLPDRPTPRFAPLGWDDVRQLAHQGVTFGPHSLTHPTLLFTPDAEAQEEVEESWKRLQVETSACAPVFCYPIGDSQAFGSRDVRLVERAGLRWAVTSIAGYVNRSVLADPAGRFTIPRFPYTDSTEFYQIVSGVERVKMEVRRLWARASGAPSSP
jgi:peptidoglycan/xylan/chitin deacetylase (PgdA/CDA1 family)